MSEASLAPCGWRAHSGNYSCSDELPPPYPGSTPFPGPFPICIPWGPLVLPPSYFREPPPPPPQPPLVPRPLAPCPPGRGCGPPAEPETHTGAEYLHSSSNVYIKVPNDGKRLWEHQGGQFAFKDYKVGIDTTVRHLIERLGGGEDQAITECYETGGGQWTKGRTVTHMAGEAVTLEALGMTERRDTTAPVWVCMHD